MQFEIVMCVCNVEFDGACVFGFSLHYVLTFYVISVNANSM